MLQVVCFFLSIFSISLRIGLFVDNESHESNGDRDSSGFTPPSALDDIELFDVTSRPREQQE